VVEDNPAHAALARRAFDARGPVTLTIAGTLREARAALTAGCPDLALVDMVLPDGRGIDLLPPKRSALSFPIIVMTSQGDEQAAVEAMRAGATDYIVKSGQTFSELPHTVDRALREWRLERDKRAAEAAQRKSEARLAKILEISPDAIICVTPDSDITLYNQGAARTFGYTADEVMGRSVGLLIPEAHRAQHARMVAEFAQNPDKSRGMGTPREVVALRKDGTEFPAEAAISRFALDGEVTLTVSLRDMSVQREQEAELRQSQKMHAIGELTGGVAHDFNNLLAVVLTNLELALDDAGRSDELGALLLEAKGAADRGADLVGRLLAFSRRTALAPSVLDMNGILEGMLGLVHRTLGASYVVRAKQQGSLWACSADRSKLENVLLNLVINARDALEPGGVVTLSTSNLVCCYDRTPHGDVVAHGEYVCLEVSDTGHGMSSAVLLDAIVPFFTTKGVGQGSGLGLSMAHGFALQSNGHLWLESIEGQGTTIRLCLPRVRAGAEAGAGESPGGARRTGAAPGGRGEVILVVEDERALRRATMRLLRKLGYSGVQASDVASALELLEGDTRIDLVFTDHVLPGTRLGADLASEVCQRWPEIPVILTSGSVNGEEIRSLPSEVLVLQKPCPRDKFADALAATFGARAAQSRS